MAPFTSFNADVITVSESPLWSVSTPIVYLPASCPAAKIELQICPPHEKMTSVPPAYHDEALDLISGDSENVPVYV